THQVGLPGVLDLAATLGRLPQRLIVYGVIGREFSPGRALSAELEPVVSQVATAIRNEIDARAVPGAVAARSG
ncbi:MAG: hypothetical protein KDA75_10415, partial [Planctomycetaceae bacterium]|nr:hypothetical protein [Planctomycetaceae bacterium]